MATRREKINKRLIDSLTAPDPSMGELIIIDTDLNGFGFRLKSSGSGAYFIKYTVYEGRLRKDRRLKIADQRAAPDEVRAKARQLLAEVAMGSDPSAKRHEARKAATVSEVCDKYLEAARKGLVTTRFRRPKRASTVAIDEGRIARHITPLIGDKLANTLTRRDVQLMSDAISVGKTSGVFKTSPRGIARVSGGAGTAARVVELLGGIWTWAEKRGLVAGQNPVRGVDRVKGETKERVLSAEDITKLGVTLNEYEAKRPLAVAALRLVALTGMRKEEACALRWEEIDAGASCIRLEVTKTTRSIRPIGKVALKLLEELPQSSKTYCFPSRDGKKSADLKKSLAEIFDAAGLKDVRSQTLRRTFASFAAEEGYSEGTIGELIGHAKRGVTDRHYIRRPDAALLAAADKVSTRIADLLAGKSAQVLHLITKPKMKNI